MITLFYAEPLIYVAVFQAYTSQTRLQCCLQEREYVGMDSEKHRLCTLPHRTRLTEAEHLHKTKICRSYLMARHNCRYLRIMFSTEGC